jgi:hypothetical protein
VEPLALWKRKASSKLGFPNNSSKYVGLKKGGKGKACMDDVKVTDRRCRTFLTNGNKLYHTSPYKFQVAIDPH